jgi:hypothetical protein
VTLKNLLTLSLIFEFFVSKIKMLKGISGLMKSSSTTCVIIDGIKLIFTA